MAGEGEDPDEKGVDSRRFAGDALNKIVRAERRDRSSGGKRVRPDPEWDAGPTENRMAEEAARNNVWKAVSGNRIMRLNEMQVIGDSTLPGLYDGAVHAYRRAIVDRALELELKEKKPPLVALAQAMREVSPSAYTGGLPPGISFLRQYAETSRDPRIRRYMDLPENGDDEWGVLMSPVEAIQERNRQSLFRGPSAYADGEDDLF